MIDILTPITVKGEGIRSIEVTDIMSLEALREALSHVSQESDVVGIVATPIEISICGNVAEEVQTLFVQDKNVCICGWAYKELKQGEEEFYPLNEPQIGSVRDDFNLGHLVFYRTSWLKRVTEDMVNADCQWRYSALYDVYLRALEVVEEGSIICRNETCGYSVKAVDMRASGEKQFDYVNPRNREVQEERETVCTLFLQRTGAWVDSNTLEQVNYEGDYPCEMSVVIPVYNRVSTVADAVRSALSQKADFDYNVIVVDNHSTDGTTALLADIARENERLVHLVPESRDLLIGGCWNYAVNSDRCGRFVVQLDSDDLYENEDVLSRVHDTFVREKCAMVVGSYTIVDEKLQPIPPGLIDHREWTSENGMNNALRINGLGAPRAFFTALLRENPLPNVSYGEDYAAGITLSGKYKLGRIYESLYLCRRWSGNSDASLSAEKVNRNNAYKDSLRSQALVARRANVRFDVEAFYEKQFAQWQEVRERYDRLKEVKSKTLDIGTEVVEVRYNPSRIRSTAAKVDPTSIAERRCFLCETNRPKEQVSQMWCGHEILVNPFPIFRRHLTIVSKRHIVQEIDVKEMFRLSRYLEGMVVFYNGACCGASAPDHQHYQASNADEWPLLRDWGKAKLTRRIHEIEAETAQMLEHNFDVLMREYGYNVDMINVVCRWVEGRCKMYIVPRKAFRPWQYTAEGKSQLLVSPATAEVCGVIVLPVEEHFNSITSDDIADIYSQVCYDK